MKDKKNQHSYQEAENDMILTGYAHLVKSKEKLLFAPRFPQTFLLRFLSSPDL